MKNNKLFKVGFLTLCCGLLSFTAFSLVGQLNSSGHTEIAQAEETEKTFFDKDYTTGWTAANYETDVTPLGFVEGKNLSIGSSGGKTLLCNISGKSASGVYWVMKLDATDGSFITSLNFSANGRFYYSNGQNTVWENFYISADGKNFGDPVNITKCLYGAYWYSNNPRTNFDIDFTSYLPQKASTVYIKWLMNPKSSSLGFSNDWTIWRQIKVTGKEIPSGEYVAPSKDFASTISDDFTTTQILNSHTYDLQNIGGAGNATHPVVPGFYGDPIVMCDTLDSYLTYFIPTTGSPITSAKIKLNAKIWNQNDSTCQNENKINVLVSADDTNYTLVKSYGCSDSGAGNNFVDLPEFDFSSAVEGFKKVYVRIQLVQSLAKNTSVGTAKAINGVSYDTHTISLSNCGVKLAKAEISVGAKYVCPSTEQTYVTKDFSSTGTDTLDDAMNVSSWVKGNPEGNYYGIYNKDAGSSTPLTASLTYKVQAKQQGALINDLKFSFSNSRYAYYSGSTPEVLKVYVSSDNETFTEAASLVAGSNKESATLDASAEAAKLKSSVVYVKVELGPSVPGSGYNKAWAVLNKISISGSEVLHNGEKRAESKKGSCTEQGIDYMICKDCGVEWDVLTGYVHTLEHHAKQDATCVAAGTKEYWKCTSCQKLFSDEKGQNETTAEALVIPAHGLEHTDAKSATCVAAGNIEYWYCDDCNKYYKDANATQECTQAETVIPAHGLEHTEAKAATCVAAGNIEYWYCDDCNKYYKDANATQECTQAETVIPAHGLEHVSRVEATCTEAGNIEYWYCDDCNKYYKDANATQECTQVETVIPAHGLEHVTRVEPTCDHDGNIEYWYCDDCNKYYQDSAATVEITQEQTILKGGHKITHVDRVEATCVKEGNIEYWVCSECHKYYSDEALTTEITAQQTIIPVIHHLDHVDAKAATCEKDGNIEYWTCPECHKVYSDAEGSVEISLADTVIKAAHKYHYVAEVAATTEKEGMKEHYTCEGCDKLFVKDAQGNYVEASRDSLIIPKVAKKGCGGSIVASGVATGIALLGAVIVLKKKKED